MLRLLPGRQPSRCVNQTMGWKFCLNLRKHQGGIETWISNSVCRGYLNSWHWSRWLREITQREKGTPDWVQGALTFVGWEEERVKETESARPEKEKSREWDVMKVKRMDWYTLRSVKMTANLPWMLSHRDRYCPRPFAVVLHPLEKVDLLSLPL